MKISLGIDIGTTKCAAVIWDVDNRNLLAVHSQSHNADLKTTPESSEQDPASLLDAVVKVVRQLPQNLRNQVSAVGITGQMHSVMGWNKNEVFPLITWQDRRCGYNGILEELRRKSGCDLHDGYGAATLARLGSQTASWEHAATIMDYLACLICGNKTPVTDASNAASWGIFDLQTNQCNFAAARALEIPERLLPELQPTGTVIGSLSEEWGRMLEIPSGIPVINAIGDNQSSILGTGEYFEQELYLTLGTGAQLSTVINEEEFRSVTPGGKLEIRPFDGSRKLAVCSALCGGRAFAWIGDMVNAVLKDLDLPLPDFSTLLNKIDALAVNREQSELKMTPSFLGERNDPDLRGAITGISLKNFSLGSLGAAAAEGILENLVSDFPDSLLKKRRLILGSGNGIRKVKTIQKAITRKFSQEFVLTDTREEACCGAAILAGRQIR